MNENDSLNKSVSFTKHYNSDREMVTIKGQAYIGVITGFPLSINRGYEDFVFVAGRDMNLYLVHKSSLKFI